MSARFLLVLGLIFGATSSARAEFARQENPAVFVPELKIVAVDGVPGAWVPTPVFHFLLERVALSDALERRGDEDELEKAQLRARLELALSTLDRTRELAELSHRAYESAIARMSRTRARPVIGLIVGALVACAATATIVALSERR